MPSNCTSWQLWRSRIGWQVLFLKTTTDDLAGEVDRSTTGDETFVSVALTGESTGKPKCNDRRTDRRINFKHPTMTGSLTGELTANPKYNDSRSDRSSQFNSSMGGGQDSLCRVRALCPRLALRADLASAPSSGRCPETPTNCRVALRLTWEGDADRDFGLIAPQLLAAWAHEATHRLASISDLRKTSAAPVARHGCL
jgi:hypothetical protein